KKFTNDKLRYPTSGANGNRSVKSTNQTNFRRYLMKTMVLFKKYASRNYFVGNVGARSQRKKNCW
ncbi:MAG: hypothetical protein KJO14_05745, partial [Nitrosopumilus sp.]|nr:hypothetical protein [Nitrosopumilus sp.]